MSEMLWEITIKTSLFGKSVNIALSGLNICWGSHMPMLPLCSPLRFMHTWPFGTCIKDLKELLYITAFPCTSNSALSLEMAVTMEIEMDPSSSLSLSPSQHYFLFHSFLIISLFASFFMTTEIAVYHLDVGNIIICYAVLCASFFRNRFCFV